MTIEHDVIQDVKDYLIDAVCQYTDCGLKPWGGDLASLLFEEPNANGTLDFSRAVSFRYLEEHPAFTAAITDRMEHEYGMLDPEDLYEYDEENDEYIESSYIEDNAEAIYLQDGKAITEAELDALYGQYAGDDEEISYEKQA